jgi:hypothetical protein
LLPPEREIEIELKLKNKKLKMMLYLQRLLRVAVRWSDSCAAATPAGLLSPVNRIPQM